MEETEAAQYALQIAIQTLKDRCKNFQYRISVLEEENINLRIQCSGNENQKNSLSELDRLKEDVAKLTEQKDQLQNKIKIVTTENQQLWSKLGKLTKINQNLGSQLHKINDSLNQVTPSTNLNRSKTFTQSEPHTKLLRKNLEENDKISLELEDVSLKLIESLEKEKMELDLLCSELAQVQNCDTIISEKFGICFDDFDDEVVNEFLGTLDEAKAIKKELLNQKNTMQDALKNITRLKDFVKHIPVPPKVSSKDKNTSTCDLTEFEKVEENLPLSSDQDKICPMCNRRFHADYNMEDFQKHVEDHFIPSSYEIL